MHLFVWFIIIHHCSCYCNQYESTEYEYEVYNEWRQRLGNFGGMD